MIGILFNADFLSKYSHLFKASLLEIQKIEFTGTISPIEKVPNWVDLTDAERLMNYDKIPKSKFIKLPEYKISDFQKGMEWSSSNKKQRNSYITFPVPNLGNYKLDGTENSGSHPGIDIKAPIGTPIRAIANGIIVKTGNQVTGFGKFISIVHTDVGNSKITLYSNYAHLSEILIKDGQKVEKGQIIGKVGNTGMATAPHLHFQLDTEDAPFHPYWPFTWNQVQKAGLNSYFEAVKYGVGKHNAQKYTIHPMEFVVKYENFHSLDNLVASPDIKIIPKDKKEDEKMKAVAPKKTIKESPKQVSEKIPKKIIEKPLKKEFIKNPIKNIRKNSNLSFKLDRNFIPGTPEKVDIHINKDFLVANAGIEISSTLKNKATVVPEKLYKKDFKNGIASVIVKTDSDYAFKLIAKGDFGEVKSKTLKPQLFLDVPNDYIYHTAIKVLKDKKVIKGYKDGTFKPQDTLNRAEALKIILVANNLKIKEQLITKFKDVKSKSWYFKYVGTALEKGIVKGYEDNTFRPGGIVTRAEFLKMAILATGKIPTNNIKEKPYPDVKITAWYAKYFQFAKKYKLLEIKKGLVSLPNQPILRGEAVDVIYRLSLLR
ncbi:S-layer homology domain-containing protein [Candidatus Harpocratesius sp.]